MPRKKSERIFKRTYRQLLKTMEKVCKRCGQTFYPLEHDRDKCVLCLKQQQADSNLQDKAFGSEFR